MKNDGLSEDEGFTVFLLAQRKDVRLQQPTVVVA